MKNFMNYTALKMASTESETGGGSGYTPAAMPAPTPARVPEPSNESVDDFGYEIEPGTEVKKDVPPPPPKADEPPKERTEDEKVEKLATGYDKDPEAGAVEDKTKELKKDEPPAPESDEEKVKKEISEVVKELPSTLDKSKVEKFALDNKLTPDQLKSYAKLVKDEEQERQNFIKTQRKEWLQDLKTDPEFGGEFFDKNVFEVEKLLQKNMPNTKKVLTERGSMLPPYIMRDLLSLSKSLNPKTTLVQGEANEVKDKETHFLDDMYN